MNEKDTKYFEALNSKEILLIDNERDLIAMIKELEAFTAKKLSLDAVMKEQLK